MNQRHTRYLIPFLLGWAVLLLGGFRIALGAGSDGTDLSLVIMVAAFGLALLLTAVVVAIVERWP
ncbi:hypothetical protein [Microtetraspora malaysiensis]|uniref:hypothetical protein n=1 Tax=Microtetraspora malaysiensis TaxID=161358 RepID=UPI003D8DDB1F